MKVLHDTNKWYQLKDRLVRKAYLLINYHKIYIKYLICIVVATWMNKKIMTFDSLILTQGNLHA